MMIKLVNDNAISHYEISALCDWLRMYPKLTKGDLTITLEEMWSNNLKINHSVFVNSGSSANLLMIYALKLSNRLRNNKVIIPSVCWSTTVAPLIQLGFEPIICDVENNNLGIDPNRLHQLLRTTNASAVIVTHILGIPSKMTEIIDVCQMDNVIILEDSCETLNSTYCGQKTGTFGLMSTFSTFFSHHLSTIEGGFVCTNDQELYESLLMLRSHGWDRDLSERKQKELRNKNDIDDFSALYSFYVPGFNLRNTEIGAFLGLSQLEKLEGITRKRQNNFNLYQKLIKNSYWKINPVLGSKDDIISNFAYPIIHPRRNELVKLLQNYYIECRPLVCGNINEQPFFSKYKKEGIEFGKIVHDYGLYLPNNQDLTDEEIIKICEIVNTITKD